MKCLRIIFSIALLLSINISISRSEIFYDSFGYAIYEAEAGYEEGNGSLLLSMTELPGWPVRIIGDNHFIPAAAVCADINGDGISNELIVSDLDDTFHSVLHCYDFEGNEMPGWPVSLDWAAYFPPAVGDINNDGSLDIVIGAGRYFYAFDNTGNIMPGRWPYITPPYTWGVISAPSLGDLTGDGFLEIGVTISADALTGAYVFDYLGNPLPNFDPAGGDPFLAGGTFAFADIDMDHNLDLVTASAWFNNQGEVQAIYRESTDWQISGFTNVACVDLNGDHELEIVIPYHYYSSSTWLKVFSSDGRTYWDFYPPYGGNNSGCAICDLDDNEEPEIVWVPSYTGGDVYCFNQDGTDHFSPNPANIDIDPGVYVYEYWSNPTCGRIFESNGKEVVLAWSALDLQANLFTDGLITILTDNGDELLGYRTYTEFGITSAPTICDLDLDQNQYINISVGDGYFNAHIEIQRASHHVFNPTTQPYDPRFMDWATLGKNRQHTGVFQQPVSGEINQDTWWYGTYKVFDDLIIPTGVTLTIKSGSIVKMDEGVGIYVRPGGNLNIEGTPLDSVYFTSSLNNQQPEYWKGIIAEDGANLSFNYATIEHAIDAVYSVESSLAFENCIITGCGNSGITAVYPYSFRILESQFTYNDLYAITVMNESATEISMNVIDISGVTRYGIRYFGITPPSEVPFIDDVDIVYYQGPNEPPPPYYGIELGIDELGNMPEGRVSNVRIDGYEEGIHLSEVEGTILGPGIECSNSINGILLNKALVEIDGSEGANVFEDNELDALLSLSSAGRVRSSKFIGGKRSCIYIEENGDEIDFGREEPEEDWGRNWIIEGPEGTEMLFYVNDCEFDYPAQMNWWGSDEPEYIDERTSECVIWDPFAPEPIELPKLTSEEIELPTNLILLQAYPNPFNANVTIRFTVPRSTMASVKVYNILGQEICELYSQHTEAGENSIIWDGRDNSGNAVASGVYLYAVRTDDEVKFNKMMLLK